MPKGENNEIKTHIQGAIQPVTERLDRLEKKVLVLQEDVTDMKRLQQKSIIFENEMTRKVDLILDCLQGIQSRFERQDATEEKVQDLDNRVSAIEYMLEISN